MLVTAPATAVRIHAGRITLDFRLLPYSGSFSIPWNTIKGRINLRKSRIRASAEEPLGPVKLVKPQRYHPSEDISDSEESNENGDAILGPAETSRTIIEVNSKSLLMFSGMIGDGFHEDIFWPDLPYVTDEHGNIYFQVKNDEDILQPLSSEDVLVNVMIGLDTAEVASEMEFLDLDQLDSDFDLEDIEDEDSDVDGDSSDEGDDDDSGSHDEDWVSALGDEEDDEDSDESLGDWAKLETMRSSHPMYFAKQLAEFASGEPIDYMDQPPVGLAIQGILRPALVEENTITNRHMLENQPDDGEAKQITGKENDPGVINGYRHVLGSSPEEEDQSLENGTSYYKLEMTKIQLISAHGNQSIVELEDFRWAQPDSIAHSAAKIIARLKAGREKTTQALISLCCRRKGIQVQEAALISLDSLGFDVRVCCGRQIETLRFAFKKKASSEYSAERQLNGMLFPRIPKSK